MSNTTKEDVFAWAEMGEKEISEITKNVTEKLKEFKSEVIKIKYEDLSFENYIHRSDFLSAEIGRLAGVLFGYTNLHTDEKIQNVGRKVELEISKVLNEFAYDMEIYQQFVNYYNGNYKKQKKTLTGEQIKIVEDSNKAYKKMGMHLDKKTKKLLLEKNNKINKLAQEFDVECVKNYEKGLWFKKEELAGIGEESLKSFKFDEKKNKYFVSVRPTEIQEIKKNCEIEKTRESLVKLDELGVGEKNNKKLREILKLRRDIVKILGYKTWGDYSMDNEMMSKPNEVNTFLSNLAKKLKPTALKTVEKYDKFLKENKQKVNTVNQMFAETQINKREKNIDENLLKEYFEMDSVLEVLFRIWKENFDLEAKLIEGETIFHPDTSVYSFTDVKNNKLLGYGSLDLFPRKLKYGHACVADIYKKYLTMNNDLVDGFTFLICNFQKGQDKTLLSYNDVTTLFHEAGHMLHMILMKNNYIATSSTSRDFVEIPSQFHENFLNNEKFVKENFKHYKTREEMPKSLLQNMGYLGRKNGALNWLRQICFALYDQEINSKKISSYIVNKKSLTNQFEKMWKNIVPIPATKEREFVSKFSHLVGGYDAKYYSYVISRVYAQDFWNEFSKGGIKRGKMSEKYKKFLEAANTRPEKDLVKEFLGRKVSLKPFLEILKN